MITAFAENEVKPLAAEIDEEERFPVETVEKMSKTGLMGIVILLNTVVLVETKLCILWLLKSFQKFVVLLELSFLLIHL